MKRLLLFILLLNSGAVFARLQKPVKWSYVAKKTSKSNAEVYIKATVASGWCINAMHVSGGPIKTSFSFTPSLSYSLTGKILAPKPTVKYDKTLKKNFSSFEKEVVFKQKVKLLKPNVVVGGVLEFIACSDKNCLPVEELAFKIPIS